MQFASSSEELTVGFENRPLVQLQMNLPRPGRTTVHRPAHITRNLVLVKTLLLGWRVLLVMLPSAGLFSLPVTLLAMNICAYRSYRHLGNPL